jgi:hypothetical protein
LFSTGVNNLVVQNFTSITSLAVNTTAFNLTIGGAVGVQNVGAAGGAHAGVSACHISPSVSGTASTEADASGTILMDASGVYNSTGNCLDVHVNKLYNVHFNQADIHDTHVTINLGPIPGVDVGALVDLVAKLIPQLTSAIENAVAGALLPILPNIINGVLPCVAF